MTSPPAPTPGFRIERCGNLFVYHPVRQEFSVPQSWAEWHKARLARSRPITYEESQAMLAVFKSGAALKAHS